MELREFGDCLAGGLFGVFFCDGQGLQVSGENYLVSREERDFIARRSAMLASRPWSRRSQEI